MKRSMLVVLFLLGMVGVSFGHDLPDAPGTTFIDRVNHLQQDAFNAVSECYQRCQELNIPCDCSNAYADYIWAHPLTPTYHNCSTGSGSFSWNPAGQGPNSISVQLYNSESQPVQRTVTVVNGGCPDRRLDSGAILLNGVLVAGPTQIRSDVSDFSFPLSLPAGMSTLVISTTSARAGELFLNLQ